MVSVGGQKLKIGGKEVKLRPGAWIILPALILAWLSPQSANASIEPGLSVSVYDNYTGNGNSYNNAPPIPPSTFNCLNTIWTNVNWNFDTNPVCGLWDDFQVKIEGYITVPTSGTYTLYLHGDDGVKLYLDDVLEMDAWYDSGNAGYAVEVSFTAGVPKKLLAWYYENGGGAFVRLDYLVGSSYVPVPESWFTQTSEQENSTTTTTIAPYLNSPQNLVITSTTETKVYLEWSVPEESNTPVERYAVFFSHDNWESAWASSFTQTSAVIENLNPSSVYQFRVRADNDSIPVYSGWSNEVSAVTSNPTTTSTTAPPSNQCGPYDSITVTGKVGGTVWGSGPYTDDSNFSAAAVHAGLIEVGETASIEPFEVDYYQSYDGTNKNGVNTYDWNSGWCGFNIRILGSQISTTSTTSTSTTQLVVSTSTPSTEPEITTTIVLPFPESTSSTIVETTTTEVPVVSTTTPVEEENVGIGVEPEPSVQEALPEPEQLPENETQTQETAPELPVENDNTEEISTQSMSADDIYESATSMLDEPLTDEQFNTVLETIFDEPLSDEQFEAAITAVLDSELTDEQFSEVVSILNGDSVTEEQVSSAVTSIIKNGITEDQATELATSAKVLESISADVAAEIFQEINVESLTEEQSAEIVAAIQNAPTEIKESFEEEINVFDGAFDAYVPVDSTVSVGERRTIVAVTVVSSVIAISAAAAPPAPGAPSGGGSSGGESPSGGDNGGNKPRRRRGGIK